MEQLNSMLSRLKRSFNGENDAGASTPGPEKQKPPDDSYYNSVHDTIDSEDDDFVMVERKEFNITNSSSTRGLPYPEHPFSTPVPSACNQVYHEHNRMGIPDFTGAGCLSSDRLATDSESEEPHSTHLAISGVPFQLNPRLQEKDQLLSTIAQLDLETRQFDWRKYFYDFDFEHSSLQELHTYGNTESL